MWPYYGPGPPGRCPSAGPRVLRDDWCGASGGGVTARLREPRRRLGLGRQLGTGLDELERRPRLIHELAQLQILGRDGAPAPQSLEVDHFFPERRTVEEHRNRTVELAGLRQRQDLE